MYIYIYIYIYTDHLFAKLERQDQVRGPNRKCVQTIDALIDEWNNLPADTVQRYVNSMRRRLVACVDANGSRSYSILK